jgi:hypothetical protein
MSKKRAPEKSRFAPAHVSVDDIIAYESGEMDEEEAIAFFQKLIDTGLAWQLQGSYGRSAAYLIEAGLCRNRR